MTIQQLLKQPARLRGIANAFSGAASIALAVYDPTIQIKYLAMLNAVTFLVTGLIGALTDGQKGNTVSEVMK